MGWGDTSSYPKGEAQALMWVVNVMMCSDVFTDVAEDPQGFKGSHGTGQGAKWPTGPPKDHTPRCL
eukprot:4729959-Karenia_brevis.AAC.1